MMKTLLPLRLSLLVFALACTTCAKAQYVTIPDAAFVTWLKTNGYNACFSGNQLDTTCATVLNATTMFCNGVPVRDLSGIQYFKNLTNLQCSYDSLYSIPSFPPKLKLLMCNANNLTSIPPLPDSLTSLNCSLNYLQSIPPLPSTLQYLDCFSTSLTSLPALPAGLTSLYCGDNIYLTTLPALPTVLKILDCSFTALYTLPPLGDSLTDLRCIANSLTSLPALPNTLTKINCSDNSLGSLPPLPTSLKNFTCVNNLLTALPPLPVKLYSLYCDSNLLTALPHLPAGLRNLSCSNNQLLSLPELPDTISLHCDNNPNLRCLPRLKTINYIDFNNCPIACLPNYGNVFNSSPFIDSFPLCGPSFNPDACPVYWNIGGRAWKDTIANCISTMSEPGVAGLKMKLYSGGVLQQQRYTTASGFYSFDVSFGNFTIAPDTASLPLTLFCPDSSYLNASSSPVDSFSYDNNFGFRCPAGFDLSVQGVFSAFRPGIVRPAFIHAGDAAGFLGMHCAYGVAGAVTVIIDGPAKYKYTDAPALTPSIIYGDTLIWQVADFGTVDPLEAFNFFLQTDTTAQIGQTVCITAIVSTPVSDDFNTSNDTFRYCRHVVNSFDPNDKTAYPAGNIDTALQWLTYIVNFQNTGTAEAIDIYIDDTLDVNSFDISTFKLLDFSHRPDVYNFEGGIIRFNFSNINLPDSVHDEPNSHGYIQYKVKLKEGLPIGTEIKNTAHIYFDFNAPVVTNTTVNTITLPTGISPFTIHHSLFTIFPNPAKDYVQIILSENTNNAQLELCDAMGRTITRQVLSGTQLKLNTTELAAGMYLLRVKTENGTSTARLMIE